MLTRRPDDDPDFTTSPSTGDGSHGGSHEKHVSTRHYGSERGHCNEDHHGRDSGLPPCDLRIGMDHSAISRVL
jgi:hypothetical protein